MIRLTLSTVLVLVIIITGCGNPDELAPVVDSRWAVQNTNQSLHRVQPGETLYAIAFRYDKDYQKLAVYNHLQNPYAIRVGQIIRLQYPNYSQKSIRRAWLASLSHR